MRNHHYVITWGRDKDTRESRVLVCGQSIASPVPKTGDVLYGWLIIERVAIAHTLKEVEALRL